MLSYRHAYHAGNHADILKHCTLMLITRAFCKKDKPFVYFDTHAGAALYALNDERAAQTGEAQNGIIRLMNNMPILAKAQNTADGVPLGAPIGSASMDTVTAAEMPQSSALQTDTAITTEMPQNGAPHNLPKADTLTSGSADSFTQGFTILREYTSFCEELYKNGALYPGSPAIVSRFAREKDALILMEKHNTEIEVLRQNVKTLCTASAPRIHVHHCDGFEHLCALTPPKSPLASRGFVLIDPSYETDSDFTDCAETILTVHKRWRGGTVALWYPLLSRRESEIARLKDTFYVNNLETLCAELIVDAPHEHGLYGSGMLVINPTWQLEEQLRAVLPVLCRALEAPKADSPENTLFKPTFSLSVENKS